MYQYLCPICKIPDRSTVQAVNRIAAGVFLLAVAVSPAHAQFRASIQGTVTDPTGAVIPGATLTLTDLGAAKVNTTTSDGNGLYNFNALPPDQYSLAVSKSGFKQKTLGHLQLISEQANAVNVQLDLGGASQTVTVNDGVTSNPNFGQANSALGSRTLNLQARFSF